MNTEQIERLIRRHVRDFDGVFSIDRLPSNPRLLVCNTDPSHRPGEHWVAMYVDGKGCHGEYFDSFGRPPPETLRRYLNEHCMYWNFNDSQSQSVASRFCGHYCVFYCILRSRDIDMRRIVSSFSRDTGFNDVLVALYVCNKSDEENVHVFLSFF